jgi:hypothetical protein
MHRQTKKHATTAGVLSIVDMPARADIRASQQQQDFSNSKDSSNRRDASNSRLIIVTTRQTTAVGTFATAGELLSEADKPKT